MVGWDRVARTSMNSLFVHMTVLVIGGFLPCSPVMGQDIDGILAASPVRVQSDNPVHNNNATKFGSAVALEVDLLVVGAPYEDSSTNPNDPDSGAVYVFERQGLEWVQRQRVAAPIEIPYEWFGTSVDVALGDEGIDFLIVGAPNSQSGQGRAYFFKRTNGGQWLHEATVTHEEPEDGDRFGQAVAIDYFDPPYSPSDDPGFFAAVGSPMNSSQAGSVTIFQRLGGSTSWSWTHDFFGDHADLLGSSVSMAEQLIVAGAEGLDEAFFNAGGARIITQGNFKSPHYHYAEGKLLIASDPVVGVGLGTVAATSNEPVNHGSIAALGAPLHDDGNPNTGKVYVFDLSFAGAGTSYTEAAAIQAPGTPAGAAFGTSVAVWGTLLAAGAPGVGADGTVYLYERGADLSEWNLAGTLEPPDLPPVGHCQGGTAVALKEITAAVGCPAPQLDNRGVFLWVSGSVFNDGFETGNTFRWSGGTDSCPPCTEDIGCRVVDGNNIFVVPMGLGQSGYDICSAQGYQCTGVPVMTPPESACLAFHPGADVSSDANGWRQAVWCNDDDGLACDGRVSCHHCPDCITTGLTCGTSNSVNLSELFVECVCAQ